MSQFTERENAFIDGLVHVMETSQAAYEAEQAAEKALEANIEQTDALREERPFELSDLSAYIDAAVERSPFDEHDAVTQSIREGLVLAQQIAEELNARGLERANRNLPVL